MSEYNVVISLIEFKLGLPSSDPKRIRKTSLSELLQCTLGYSGQPENARFRAGKQIQRTLAIGKTVVISVSLTNNGLWSWKTGGNNNIALI